MIGILGIVQSGVQVDAPACAPSRRLVALQFKGARGSTVDGLLAVHAIVEVMTRIDAKQVALMTMVRILILPVIEPLLQVALMANLIGMQTSKGLVNLSNEGLVESQHLGGSACVTQAFANHGDIGKATKAGASVIAVGGNERVLGRGGWCGDEVIGS